MDVLDGLNAEQRRAAEAVRGPVCILAGAGSGKTTTITRRIAQQVATGAFRAGRDPGGDVHRQGGRRDEVAARGARRRGRRRADVPLGGARLSSTATRPGAVGRILPTKALALAARSPNALPAPFRFRPAGDLATEIEWAKAQRHRARGATAPRSATHEPPIPADLMDRVYREYERRKARARRDRLRGPARARRSRCSSPTRPRAPIFASAYRAFTVDEYQDVNLLQQSLLDLWLGDARRPLRRRRRLPVDLRVHRAPHRAGCSAIDERFPAARRSCGSRTTTAPRRRCSRSQTGSCRGSAAPRRCCARRATGARAAGASVRGAGGRGRLDRRRPEAAARRKACRSRRSRSSAAPTPGSPTSRRCCTTPAAVPGLVAARARGGAPAAPARSTRSRDAGGRRPRRERSPRMPVARGAPRQARRARADAPGRPRPARAAGGRVRRRSANWCRVRRRAPPPLRSGRRERARRAPAHLPPLPRGSSSTLSSCRGSTRRSCRRSSRAPRPSERRSAVCSTSA